MRRTLKELGFVAATAVAGLTLSVAANAVDETFQEAPVSRAQVIAELREAERLGLIPLGEADIPVQTAEQTRLIAKAGEDAVTKEKVASK